MNQENTQAGIQMPGDQEQVEQAINAWLFRKRK
jgi:hypothetical protein